MTGFEQRISGVGSNCSTNWATTTANFEPFDHPRSIKVVVNFDLFHFEVKKVIGYSPISSFHFINRLNAIF